MVGEKLDDVVDPVRVELLKTESGGGVEPPAAPREEARVDDVLGERVLEAVHELRIVCAREDEVNGMEVLQVPAT